MVSLKAPIAFSSEQMSAALTFNDSTKKGMAKKAFSVFISPDEAIPVPKTPLRIHRLAPGELTKAKLNRLNTFQLI